MRLVCPTCGAVASLEAWSNDADCRSLIQVLVGLPSSVQTRAIEYLGLFRASAERGLTWRKALKVAQELAAIVGTGRIQWDNGEDRPASPDTWGRALEAVLTRRPSGLKNHNYLRHTAWTMAAEQAGRSEREHEHDIQARPRIRPVSGGQVAGPGENGPESGQGQRGSPSEPARQVDQAGFVKPAYTEEQRQNGLQRILELKAAGIGRKLSGPAGGEEARRQEYLRKLEQSEKGEAPPEPGRDPGKGPATGSGPDGGS